MGEGLVEEFVVDRPYCDFFEREGRKIERGLLSTICRRLYRRIVLSINLAVRDTSCSDTTGKSAGSIRSAARA
jgi:hypothetical protein